jgi:predicted nucleotidyltransferase
MDPVSRLERRVEERLAHLDALFGRAGVRYALIGATAILLQGIDLPRTTRDLDLAVSVEQDLDEVRALLEAHGLRSTTTRHRFTAEDGLEIDVLPIRPGTDRVELPGGDSISRVGLDEAIAASVRVAFHDGGTFVAPLPVLASIKLYIATLRSGGHDLGDALALLDQYESAGARRFDIDYIAEGDLSWEAAGAWLAGRDAQGILLRESSAATLTAVEQLLSGVVLSDRFARGPENRALLAAFRAGLAHAS